MKRLRILLWCPLVGMGGGHRLLGHLLKALTNQSLVEHVKIVHPHWSADMKASIVDPSVSSIEFSESEEGGFISWFSISGAQVLRNVFSVSRSLESMRSITTGASVNCAGMLT
jgi:hypothetical protein